MLMEINAPSSTDIFRGNEIQVTEKNKAAKDAHENQGVDAHNDLGSPVLSAEQQSALELINMGQNVFVTGGAGTGKSFLIRQFLKDHDAKSFPVLASTGAAAVLVGGRTFHSFFALGILEGGVEATIAKAMSDRRLRKRLNQVQGIVIDEVSMIDGVILAAAEEIARRVRKSPEVWGGIQVIAVGDFFQLPPVVIGRGRERPWAFLHPVWQRTAFRSVVLQENLRAAEDAELVQTLARVRQGQITDEVRLFLDRHVRMCDNSASLRLYPRRAQADEYNRGRLAELPGEEIQIASLYSGSPRGIDQLKRAAPIAEELVFKVGAQVMLRQNDPLQRWVNGSLGIVKYYEPGKLMIELRSGYVVSLDKADFTLLDADGNALAIASNYPLNLAYATTIHKAQGATLDHMVVDLRSLWEPGHAYVAMSRVRRSEDLFIVGWDEHSIRVDKAVIDYYGQLAQEAV